MKSTAQPPIWVISLERAALRRDSITTSLDAVGLDYEVIDAVDGGMLTDGQRAQYSRTRALLTIGRGLGWGEIGCALSHLDAYERLIRSGAPVGVVMEDDVVASADLPGVLERLDSIAEPWDVITLHSLFDDAEPVPIDREPFYGRYRLCRYRRVTYGAQCYVITRDAAHRLLDVARPIRIPADDLIYRPAPAALRVLGVEPKVAELALFDSELVDREQLGEDPQPRVYELPIVWAAKGLRRLRR
jgi:glycosyl transferase family 25